ncbi:MAG: site-2 protease family protein, partial [Gemmatimonadetes bacterium]|nr:site-2 protease family protein [Gemmatimonadota bacterium]
MALPPIDKPDVGAFLDVVDEYHIGLYGVVEVVRARLLPGLRGNDPDVLAALASWGGEVHVEEKEGAVDVVLVRTSGSVRERWLLHIGLFLATLITTLAAGALMHGIDPVRTRFIPLGQKYLLPVPTGIDLPALWAGAVFALPFLGILLAHESGHYVAARRHKIPVTPPFFIPFPPWYSLVGTLGAFIRIKGPTVRRSVLLDVAGAGPLASFFLSLPALLVGLTLSGPAIGGSASVMTPFVVRFAGETVRLGNGPLLHVLGSLFFPGAFGVVPIELHPLAFAGWLGMFVTALNLLPLGQLDGGHILYCLWEQPGQV